MDRNSGLGRHRATKTLAKVANHVAKKDEKHGGAVLLLDEQAQDAALARIELTDLWGVAGRLAAIGIATPLDLKRGDPWLIRERLGVVTMRLALELRGVPCLAFYGSDFSLEIDVQG